MKDVPLTFPESLFPYDGFVNCSQLQNPHAMIQNHAKFELCLLIARHSPKQRLLSVTLWLRQGLSPPSAVLSFRRSDKDNFSCASDDAARYRVSSHFVQLLVQICSRFEMYVKVLGNRRKETN